MRLKYLAVIGISLWAVSGASCAQLPPVESRTPDPKPAPVAPTPAPAPAAASETLLRQQLLEQVERIDLMEREIRQLRNDVEVLSHELESTKARQRQLYLDLDRRLRKLEERGSAPAPQPGTGGGSAATDDGTAAPAGAGTGQENAPSAEQQAAYRTAFNLLKERRYPQAIAAFEGFLKTYPDSYYADNARYWLGEANRVTEKYQAAIEHFQRVISDFPDSGKIPDALLKVGYSYYELKQWDKARQSLQAVVRRFPDDATARLAKERLKRMQEEGH